MAAIAMIPELEVAAQRRRWKTLLLALVVAIAGIAGTVLATEMRIDATEPTTVSVPDVARSMRGRGLEVAETGTVVTHRVLRVAGERLQIDGVSVDVYLYPSAAERVADEQRWNDQIMGLTSTRADPPRVTSVENVLVLIASSDPDLHLTVTRALNDLSGRSTVQILAQ